MNKAVDAAPEQALEIRFGQVGLAQLRLRTTDAGAIHDQLAARIAAAPPLFERAAVCIDLTVLPLDVQASDLRGVIDAVRRTGMLPVGLTHSNAVVDALGRELDLPVLTQFRAQTKAVTPAPRPATAAPTPAAAPEPVGAPTLMHHKPVRSGQRIYARQRDLVVTGAVGAGAEVIADGCVHVYSTLRGRAVAGAHGEVTARVFCQHFHAELVSIAGVFRVFETIPAELAGQPVQAWLEGDSLRFAVMGTGREAT